MSVFVIVDFARYTSHNYQYYYRFRLFISILLSMSNSNSSISASARQGYSDMDTTVLPTSEGWNSGVFLVLPQQSRRRTQQFILHLPWLLHIYPTTRDRIIIFLVQLDIFLLDSLLDFACLAFKLCCLGRCHHSWWKVCKHSSSDRWRVWHIVVMVLLYLTS